jgi:hypothetical protein
VGRGGGGGGWGVGGGDTPLQENHSHATLKTDPGPPRTVPAHTAPRRGRWGQWGVRVALYKKKRLQLRDVVGGGEALEVVLPQVLHARLDVRLAVAQHHVQVVGPQGPAPGAHPRATGHTTLTSTARSRSPDKPPPRPPPPPQCKTHTAAEGGHVSPYLIRRALREATTTADASTLGRYC